MFVINEDSSIYVTRGDMAYIRVTCNKNGKPYTFQVGDVVRFNVCEKKKCENVVLQKDFPVTALTQGVDIVLDGYDTKIGEIISKPVDYWYEVVLNPFDNPQTIIGYDAEGTRVFRLYPEANDKPAPEPKPEVIKVIDTELDMTSERPVQNQAIARAFYNLQAGYQATHDAVTAIHVTPQMFGAIGDGEADDTEAVQTAINSGAAVHFPSGEYLVGEITIDNNCVIYGDVKNKPVIRCRGIVLNGEVSLSGLTILPASGYEGTGVLVNKGGSEVADCVIYSFNIGLELSPTKHIIGGVFKNITIGYCKHAGVKSVASGTAQNNQILFEHLYIVKCGTEADNDTATSTKFENGFGMYLDGGYGIEVRNCVFEYNTGVGLYLAQNYPLCGCCVSSPYFEHNKYAQLYVANSTGTYMRNVHISGDFYTDANRSLPDDAMENRALYVENNGNLKTGDGDVGNYFSEVSARAYGYSNRYCPQNLFPYDVIGELCNPHLVLGKYNGEKVWAINQGGVMVYGCPIPVEKGEYKVMLDVAHDADGTQTYVMGLSNHSDGSKTWTQSANKEWVTAERAISFTKSGICYLYVSNSNANGTCFIRNIRITRA